MGVEGKGPGNAWPIEDSLEELALLTRTAGAEVVGASVQRRQRPTPAYYVGKGKLEELTELKQVCIGYSQ